MRILFCTYNKCGSQWFRDLMCHHLLADAVPYRYHPPPAWQIDPLERTWPEIPDGAFCGPLYELDAPWVLAHTEPDDRVICLLRDPRDVVVSWIYSTLYSHRDNRESSNLHGWRRTFRRLPDDARLPFAVGRKNRQRRMMLSWLREPSDQILVIRYEELLDDTAGVLGRCFGFLGVSPGEGLIGRVVEQLAFATRSGREPGEQNIHSHYRKGVAGDWRNHFDRDLGETFELMDPGLLCELGYEADTTWWRSLPERESVPVLATPTAVDDAVRQLVELEERNRTLQLVAEERLQGLEDLTRECREKDEAIHRLHATAKVIQESLDGLSGVAAKDVADLLAQIGEKEEEIRRQQEANALMRDRLDAIGSEQAAAIGALHGQIEEKERQIEELATACREREEDIREVHRVNDELRHSVDAYISRHLAGNELMEVGLRVLRRRQRFRRLLRAILWPVGGVWLWKRVVKPLIYGKAASLPPDRAEDGGSP